MPDKTGMFWLLSRKPGKYRQSLGSIKHYGYRRPCQVNSELKIMRRRAIWSGSSRAVTGSLSAWGREKLWCHPLHHHSLSILPLLSPCHPSIRNHSTLEPTGHRGRWAGDCDQQFGCPSANSAPGKSHVSPHRRSASRLKIQVIYWETRNSISLLNARD